MYAYEVYKISEPMMVFVGAEVYDSDGSSGTDSPVEKTREEASIEPAGALDKVGWVCEELKRLRALCFRQSQELEGMEILLEEAEVELVETKGDLRAQQERAKFLNQAVACDHPVRSVYMERYKATIGRNWMDGSTDCVDMRLWKANAGADALLYLEDVRDDRDVFEGLYGMPWESVLGIGTCFSTSYIYQDWYWF